MVCRVILEIHLNLERKFLCVCTLQLQVADALRSTSNHVHHFIPIQFVVSWLGGIPFGNGLVYHIMCASWRLAREIVADKNRLGKFCKLLRTCKAYLVRCSDVQDLAEAGDSYGLVQ